jgi:hypothetical protein
MKQALVVSGLGVAGQGIVQHLAGRAVWTVYVVSRRTPEVPGGPSYVPVDLLES